MAIGTIPGNPLTITAHGIAFVVVVVVVVTQIGEIVPVLRFVQLVARRRECAIDTVWAVKTVIVIAVAVSSKEIAKFHVAEVVVLELLVKSREFTMWKRSLCHENTTVGCAQLFAKHSIHPATVVCRVAVVWK